MSAVVPLPGPPDRETGLRSVGAPATSPENFVDRRAPGLHPGSLRRRAEDELLAAADEQLSLRLAAERQLRLAMQQMERRQQELRIVQELSRIGSFYGVLGSGSLWWSEQSKVILGRDPRPVPTNLRECLNLVHHDDRHALVRVIDEAVRTVGEYDISLRTCLDGEVREIRSLGRVTIGPEGPAIVGSLQDLTEIRAASADLIQSRDLFAAVLAAATEQSIIATDAAGLVTVFNTGAERMLGYPASEMIGVSLERFHDPGEIEARATKMGISPGIAVTFGTAGDGLSETRDWTYLTRDGRRRRVLVTVNPMFDGDGGVAGYMSVGTDITERLEAQTELAESEVRFRDTFEYAPNGMMFLDIDPDSPGRFLKVNPGLCQLTGYSESELLTMTIGDLAHPENAVTATAVHTEVTNGVHPTVRRWTHADGHELWVQLSISPVRSPHDTYVVGQVEDITGRRSAEAKLTHQALHDWLTGLPNRLLLMDRIEHALAASTRSGRVVGLLYIDLDGFKAVNDTGGHAAGDHTLIHLADRIRHVVRPGDTVARLGGDEFVVVCNDLDDIDVALLIAERVLAAIRIPHSYLGRTYRLGASIGVSTSRTGSDPDRLLREADEAMYAGKVAGKGRVRIAGVHPAGAVLPGARGVDSGTLEAELALALAGGQLVLFGQTIHDLDTGRVVAVEHLLRWNHPDRGLLLPADFLDVAENSELMTAIGRLVLDESCRLARLWCEIRGAAAPPVHVNVSGRQLESGRLLNDVLEALHTHELAPAQLVLELTETHATLLTDDMRRELAALRERGVRLAIDDLGTGHSSMSGLTDLAVDLFKIDVQFISRFPTDPAANALVSGVLAVAKALARTVVSEGIETRAQADALRAAGCRRGQGYLYGVPVPAAELLDRVSAD